MIKNNIMEFLTGTLIPLTLLPEILQKISRFFPFYYVYYYPTLLYMNIETGNILMAIVVLISWNIFMTTLNIIAYSRMKMAYEGVGI
jgi:ABC-2 type transport system permease protein